MPLWIFWLSFTTHKARYDYQSKAHLYRKKVLIRKGARLETVDHCDGTKPKLIIGDNTSIHFYFHCGAAESVTIGNDVLIAGRVYITHHDHVFDEPARLSGKLK